MQYIPATLVFTSAENFITTFLNKMKNLLTCSLYTK